MKGWPLNWGKENFANGAICVHRDGHPVQERLTPAPFPGIKNSVAKDKNKPKEV